MWNPTLFWEIDDNEYSRPKFRRSEFRWINSVGVADGPNKHHLCQLGSCTLDNLLTRESSYVVLKHAKSIGIHSKHTLFYLQSFTFKELLSLVIRELPRTRRQGDKEARRQGDRERFLRRKRENGEAQASYPTFVMVIWLWKTGRHLRQYWRGR